MHEYHVQLHVQYSMFSVTEISNPIPFYFFHILFLLLLWSVLIQPQSILEMESYVAHMWQVEYARLLKPL